MSEHEVNDDDEIGNRVEWKYNGTRKARGGKNRGSVAATAQTAALCR